jgi:hypothetical protein
MGPSDAPMITSPQILFFLNPFVITSFDLILKVFAIENLSQIFGKIIVRPKKKIMLPEIHFQKS